MKRVIILPLIILFTFFLTLSAFALIRPSETAGWKEDILTLLPLAKRVGDYSELVELVEVAPALKEDPEIKKAYVDFAPPGATPPEWAREEKIVPPVRIEVPEKIATAEAPVWPPDRQKEKEKREREEEHREKIQPLTKEEKKEVRRHYLIGRRYYNAQEDEKAIAEFERALGLDPIHKKAIKYLSESHYHLGRKYYRDKDYEKAMVEFERALAKNSEHRKAKEYFAKLQARTEEKGERARAEEARRIALEVGKQKKPLEIEERSPVEIIKEEPMIEAPKEEVEVVTESPPEKIAIAETIKKVSPEGQAYGTGRWESEQVSREEQRMRETEKRKREKERREIEKESKEKVGVRPTSLPKGAKVIYSTDVVSGVKTERVRGKMRVIITLSGERKHTVSERSRPPAIVIDIPHTINAVSPGRIMVNQGGVRTVEVTQHRSVPFDETRVIIRLFRFREYEVKSKENEIYVEFEE